MEMCYDGALVMPNNYAVVNEEEMTYVEGGAYRSSVTTLAAAKDFFGKIAGLYALGLGISACGTAAFPGFAVTDLYFGNSAWDAKNCYNDVCKWIAKYGSNRACRVGVNVAFGVIATGVDVELLDYNIRGVYSGGGGSRSR